MADLIYPNVAGSYQQGLGFGRQMRAEDTQRRNQSRLSELAAQAYGSSGQDRQNAIQQAIGVDPQAGFAIDQQMGQQDAAREKRLLSNARLLASAPEPYKAALYRQIYPQVAQDLPGLPQEWTPEVAQGIDAFIASRSGGAQNFDRFRNVGGSLIDLAGDPTRPIYQSPGAPIMTSAGLVRPTATGVELLELGGAQPTGLQPEQDFAALGQQFGLTPTSVKRSAQRNDEVGGVPNSFHLTGQAADWVVPPDQKPAFMQAAQRRGYQAIDEGDHVHIEPTGSPGASSAAGGRRLGPPVQAITPYQQAQLDMGRERLSVAQNAREQAAAARQDAADAKASAKRQEAGARQAESAASASDLVSAIDALESHPGFESLGTALGDAQITVPVIRNDAKDADAQLRNISGQVALATMNRLKALSAQGATGFGALSQNELTLLQNSIATLQRENISNKQLKDSLKVIKDKMEKVTNWSSAGAQNAREITTQAEFDALPSGAVYLEDGVQYRKP